MNKALVSEERIVGTIVTVRGRRVVIASDLAALYGVSTRRLNEQVKRNRGRFPSDFCFRLTTRERDEVVANCDHLAALKFAPALPYAFTEYGSIMAANVLNSRRAVDVSVQVVRAFMSLNQLALAYHDVIRKLDALEKRHDRQFKVVFDALRQLLKEHEKAPIAPRSGSARPQVEDIAPNGALESGSGGRSKRPCAASSRTRSRRRPARSAARCATGPSW